MRAIKFRAWDGKQMVVVTDLTMYANSKNLYKINDDVDSIGDSRTEEVPWPLMQFTGLTDHDGKEIWEGDIMRVFQKAMEGALWSELGVMTWCEKEAKFSIEIKNGSLDESKLAYVRVCGNRYEHPHLLETP